jgi:hypothetical protein
MAKYNSIYKTYINKENSFIPKQLLDIGVGASKKSIRLYKSYIIREPYIALSYY